MTTNSGTDRFLQVLFPGHEKYAIFATDDGQGHWVYYRGAESLKGKEALGCYVTLASYPHDNSNERTNAHALGTHVLVIDDVGTYDPVKQQDPGWVELMLGKPTAKVLTSEGNAQWWYRLSRLVSKAEWPGFKGGVEALLGKKLDDGGSLTQPFRLPMGRNLKKDPDRGNFEVRLIELNPEIELSVDTITPAAPPKSAGSSGDAPKLSIEAFKTELLSIPNTKIDRKGWVDVGFRCKARLAEEDWEAGAEIYLAWTQRDEDWGSRHFDTDEYVRNIWEGINPTSTGGFELDKMFEAADPQGYAAWCQQDVWKPGEAARAFDDDAKMPPELPKPKGITATPFKLRDASSLALRDWLYGNILIRKFITMTVAPGGQGKSSLIAAETLAQVTGCSLLWEKAKQPLRVWLWNLEDPFEETERKIVAAALRHGVTDIGDRLFVDSGRDQRLVIATVDRNKAVIRQPVVDALVAEIKRRKVDVVVIDPFVSCHEVPENDNIAQDKVVKEWGRVAELGDCAVHLIDHTRKAPNGTEVWTESARGAKAKTDAARVVRVINRMSDDEGVRHGVSTPRQYFYTLLDKANMSLPPPMDHRDWFHIESVNLGNGEMMEGMGAARMSGDDLGVVVRWTPPSAETLRTTESFEKVAEAMGNKLWRRDSRAAEWVGKAIGPALEFNEKTKSGRDKTDALLKGWLKDGLMQMVIELDKNRIEREFIQIKGKHEQF